MKKFTMSILIGIGMFVGTTFAQVGPSSFLVEVNPSSFQQNQPIDITITAMKNGQPDTSYTGDVRLGVEGLRPSEYTVPSKGRYNFTVGDLGKKTFSKGLEIKKPGTYTITASNVENTLQGKTQVTVMNIGTTAEVKTIEILSPLANGKETQSNILLLAQAPDLPNSLAQVYLNGAFVEEISIDQFGTINGALTKLKDGPNTLFLKVVSITNEELGKSEEITFTYEPLSNQLFSGITIIPSTGLRMGDKVTFEVQTNESVSSANLILSYGTRTPLDKASDGLFSRSLTLVATGMISVDIELIAMGQVKTYTGVASFEVGEMPMISNVKFQLDPNNGNNLYVSREFIGENVSGFMVHFGTGKDQLDTTITTTGLEILFQNINTMQEYFFQIFPLKGKEPEHGAATEVFTYTPPLSGHSPPSGPLTGHKTTGNVVVIDIGGTNTPLCVVKGIRVNTQKIGNAYYLVWDSVKHATSYTVYMSDIDDPITKRKLLDTKETRYEYPFDHSTERNQYAYFRVEATCDDGQVLELTGAKKVQVGPAEDVLMLVCISLLIYAGIRLYRYAE